MPWCPRHFLPKMPGGERVNTLHFIYYNYGINERPCKSKAVYKRGLNYLKLIANKKSCELFIVLCLSYMVRRVSRYVAVVECLTMYNDNILP